MTLKMKYTNYAAFAGALLLFVSAAAPLFAAPAAPAPAKQEAPKPAPTAKQLFAEAQKVARTNDLAKTQAACDAVLAAKDGAAFAYDVHMLMASVYQRQKPAKKAEMYAEYEKAAESVAQNIQLIQQLSVPDSPSAKIFKALKAKPEADFASNFPESGFASYSEDGIRKALDGYRRILAMPAIANPEKIELHRRIANCLLELMQVDEANAELQKAVNLPGLTPAEKARAQINLANALKRELEPAKALPVLETAVKSGVLTGNDKTENEIALMRLIFQVKGKDAAAAYCKSVKDNPRIENDYIEMIGDPALKARTKEAILKDPKAPLANRHAALDYFIRLGCATGDPAKFEAAFQKYAVPAIKENESFKNPVMNIGGWNAQGYAPAVRKAVAKKQIELNPQNAGGYKTFLEFADYRAERAEVLKAVEALLKIEKLSEADRVNYSVTEITLKNADGNAVVKAVKDLANASKDKAFKEPQAQADLLRKAARIAMKCGDYDKAKTIWNARQSMIVQYGKRKITCKFIPNGPKDIAEFLASDYIRDPKNVGVIDRKYGDNLEFLLLTDANLTGRQVTKGGKDFKPAKFTVSCDEAGVKFFFMMPCSPERTKQLKAGFGGFGGFEMYLAPGYDQPYFCYLIDAPPHASMSVFQTQYDNANFRQSDVKNGNTHLTYKVGNDMVYALLELDWTAIRNGIPTDGFVWEFEPLHWEGGGYSWGGSISVHNRSSFGDIVFTNMTEANRTAIKHRLLVYAAACYNKEHTANTYGHIEHWKDPELGDPEFYKEEVAPFVQKYGPCVRRIKADMTPEEINKVYDEAYMPLVNTKFIIQQKRADYLDRKAVGD